MNANMGHGWVSPRPDGAKARCGGPALCETCQQEVRALRIIKEVDKLTSRCAHEWKELKNDDDDFAKVAGAALMEVTGSRPRYFSCPKCGSSYLTVSDGPRVKVTARPEGALESISIDGVVEEPKP